VGDVILVIDSQETVRRLLAEILFQEGRSISAIAPPKDLFATLDEIDPTILILDAEGDREELLSLLDRLLSEKPRLPLILLSGNADLRTGVEAIRRGVRDFLPKPIPIEALMKSVDELIGEQQGDWKLIERRRKFRTGQGLDFYKLPSTAMAEVYEQISQVAMSRDTSVLITGESGTGKEIAAMLIHDLSPRRQAPFLELNCASIPSALLENELFGHEQGAYTDARSRKMGLVEAADGGTLFLDEIGEMSMSLQAKLLRFLENHVFRRVGGTEDRRVEVRIVSATNQDLEDLVARKQFREDLYYRLNVVPIRLPPLRDRREDILPLLHYFGNDFVLRFNRSKLELDEEARRILLEYSWPGNVRELKNLVERLVLMDSGDGFRGDVLREALGRGLARNKESSGERLRRLLDEPFPDEGLQLTEVLKDLELSLIRKAFDHCQGNQSRCAELLGLGRDKLRYRLKTHEIDREGS